MSPPPPPAAESQIPHQPEASVRFSRSVRHRPLSSVTLGSPCVRRSHGGALSCGEPGRGRGAPGGEVSPVRGADVTVTARVQAATAARSRLRCPHPPPLPGMRLEPSVPQLNSGVWPRFISCRAAPPASQSPGRPPPGTWGMARPPAPGPPRHTVLGIPLTVLPVAQEWGLARQGFPGEPSTYCVPGASRCRQTLPEPMCSGQWARGGRCFGRPEETWKEGAGEGPVREQACRRGLERGEFRGLQEGAPTAGSTDRVRSPHSATLELEQAALGMAAEAAGQTDLRAGTIPQRGHAEGGWWGPGPHRSLFSWGLVEGGRAGACFIPSWPDQPSQDPSHQKGLGVGGVQTKQGVPWPLTTPQWPPAPDVGVQGSAPFGSSP